MSNKLSVDQMKKMCDDARRLGFRPERLLLLDKRLTEWSKTDITPSIVVRVLRHGEVAFEGAYGILGPNKEPDSLTVDTIFPVCSITKPIVATLLSILQEEGYIDFNHPVRMYIPEFTGDKNSLVKIWHLLSHSSGIIDEDLKKNFNDYVKNSLGLVLPNNDESKEAWDEFYLKIREIMGLPYMEPGRNMSHDTYMSVCLSLPPTHKPQNIMGYCNTGYQLAMKIINMVTQKPIDEFAYEKLFGPLKMNDSHFIFPREKISRYVTRGKDYVGSNWLNNDILNSESGSGGLKTTVKDLTAFGQMFLQNGKLNGERVLSKASVQLLTSDHNAKLPPVIYEEQQFDSTWGLGWNVIKNKKDDSGMLRSSQSFEHGGFGCCKLMCDPVADVVITYFTVCKTDCYWNASLVNNIIIGAIDDD